jgi:transcriptional regulator with GAF, ATPase, and Fis domain
MKPYLVHAAPRTNYETPMFAVLDVVNSMRRTGETTFEAAERVLLNEALYRTSGRQDDAGKLLGTSPRVTNYLAGKYGLRPKDQLRGTA